MSRIDQRDADWIEQFLAYEAERLTQRREDALAHAIYGTPFGSGEGPETPYGPNSARTWARQGLKALNRIGKGLA